MRQLFNLRRCVLETPLVNGPTLFNTHLSAFSYGDGTVERQVSRLRELVKGKEFLLAGDLNSLTPHEDAATLAKDEAALYPESNTPAAPLYDDAGIVPLWRDASWKSRHRARASMAFRRRRRRRHTRAPQRSTQAGRCSRRRGLRGRTSPAPDRTSDHQLSSTVSPPSRWSV